MRRLTAHADMQMHQGTQAASMIQDGTIDLSFLICTFHREDQLVEAMHSVLQLEGLADIRYEILVVDNSDEESARSAVEGFAASTSCAHVRYVAAHPPNISVARNAGVEAAAGTFIAMIDDDMKVRPDWLKAMLPMMRDSAFDVLCGPVEAIYADPALATRESRFFFHRDAPLPKGTELRVMGPRRTRSFVPATSNGVFRRETCFGQGLRFDLRYGRTGGEDVDLFCRLERQGRRVGWVPDPGPRKWCRRTAAASTISSAGPTRADRRSPPSMSATAGFPCWWPPRFVSWPSCSCWCPSCALA